LGAAVKKIFLASAFAMLGSAHALAADLEPRTYTKAPVMAEVAYNWSGFYAGVNAGWVGGGSGGSNNGAVSSASTADPPNAAAMAAGATSSFRGSGGFIGGGQFGYNYQFSRLFVAGFEADIQGLSRSNRNSSSSSLLAGDSEGSVVGFATNTANTLDPSYVGTFRGRLGVTVVPSVLLYVTGGLAYGGVKSNTAISQSGINATNEGLPFTITPASGSFSGMRTGYAAGAGAEWMFASHWSAKLEYLYYDLGSVTYSTGSLASSAFGPTNFTGSGNGVVNTSTTVHLNNNIVRAGVNYHFN
jgi:outer membrane immunogenic protein